MSKEKKKTQKEILLENADDVIEMIRLAKTYEDIIKKYGVHWKYINWFISESDYSARAREAQIESAETIAAKAERALLQIEDDLTQAGVTRQRELAHHYRWLAAKKNPRKYGDSTKIQAEVKDTSGAASWLDEVLQTIDTNKNA